MQRGEREGRFALDPANAEHLHAASDAAGISEERGLPNARFATQDQAATAPVACRVEELADRVPFIGPRPEHRMFIVPRGWQWSGSVAVWDMVFKPSV